MLRAAEERGEVRARWRVGTREGEVVDEKEKGKGRGKKEEEKRRRGKKEENEGG